MYSNHLPWGFSSCANASAYTDMRKAFFGETSKDGMNVQRKIHWYQQIQNRIQTHTYLAGQKLLRSVGDKKTYINKTLHSLQRNDAT